MRISDWSSDVCSSDLRMQITRRDARRFAIALAAARHVDIEQMDLVIACDTRAIAVVDAARGMDARFTRSDERRVGKECGSTCRSRWSQYHYKKHYKCTPIYLTEDANNYTTMQL